MYKTSVNQKGYEYIVKVECLTTKRQFLRAVRCSSMPFIAHIIDNLKIRVEIAHIKKCLKVIERCTNVRGKF